MVTDTPLREAGSALPTKSLFCHTRVVWERLVPTMVTQVADAKPAWKLAPFSTAVMAGWVVMR